MKTSTKALVSDLIGRTRQNLEFAKEFGNMSLQILNYKSSPRNWSALECLAHLNFYGDYYLPEIEKRIQSSNHPAEPDFKAGLLGDYFAKMMLPGEKMKPMKTLKSTNPNGSTLSKSTIKKFIEQQEGMMKLLDRSQKISLNKTKTSISVAPMLKLKLGDTFRVVIYHNERHIAQACRAVESAGQTRPAA